MERERERERGFEGGSIKVVFWYFVCVHKKNTEDNSNNNTEMDRNARRKKVSSWRSSGVPVGSNESSPA